MKLGSTDFGKDSEHNGAGIVWTSSLSAIGEGNFFYKKMIPDSGVYCTLYYSHDL